MDAAREMIGGGAQRERGMAWEHGREKEEVSEVLLFSGLEVQSEITLLLDELYSDL